MFLKTVEEVYFRPSGKITDETPPPSPPALEPVGRPLPEADVLPIASFLISLLALGIAIFWRGEGLACETLAERPIVFNFSGKGGELIIDERLPIEANGTLELPIVFEIPVGTELMGYDENGTLVVITTSAPTYVRVNVTVPASAIFSGRTVSIRYRKNLSFVGKVNTTFGEVFGEICEALSR